jgi:uncharacterized membrane protein
MFMATASAPAPAPLSVRRASFIHARHIFFLLYGVLVVIAVYHQDLPLLTPGSAERHHLAPATAFIIPHGVFGALALVLAVFQFSTRLRQRYLWLHRLMGRVYVGSVFIAAPAAIPVAVILGTPTLVMASITQSTGWLITTAIALYCVRQGNIQQHRQWMMRSYPFAMVFVFVRATLAVPAIERLGLTGLVSVVWTYIALAGFVPSLIINWRAIFPQRSVAPSMAKTRGAA